MSMNLIEEEKQEVKDIEFLRDFISVYVYASKDGMDCTLGGVSSKYNKLYLCRDYVTLEQVKKYCEEKGEDVSRFVKVDLKHKKYTRGYISVAPIDLLNSGKWFMAGGNYIYCCDSRFREITECNYPVPIHDRVECY